MSRNARGLGLGPPVARLCRRHRRVGRRARGPRTLLRQRPERQRDGVRRRPASLTGLQESDGRDPGAENGAADSPGRRWCARRAEPRLSDPAQEGDDHLERTPAPQRARARAGSVAPHRRLLQVAGAGLRQPRDRGRPLRRRDGRLARRARRPRRRRARARSRRADRAVRRHAADRARDRQRGLDPRAARDAPNPARARARGGSGPAGRGQGGSTG